MNGSKILLIIFGALLIIGGIYCIASPGATFLSLGPVIGILMIVDSIGNICTWSSRRKAGQADGWSLAGFIISLVLGLALVGNAFVGFAADAVITYMFIFWMIAIGVMRIVLALNLRKAKKVIESASEIRGRGGQALVGKSWGFVLVMGILMVIAGILCLFNPLAAALGIGMMIGICILFSGISMLSVALSL